MYGHSTLTLLMSKNIKACLCSEEWFTEYMHSTVENHNEQADKTDLFFAYWLCEILKGINFLYMIMIKERDQKIHTVYWCS